MTSQYATQPRFVQMNLRIPDIRCSDGLGGLGCIDSDNPSPASRPSNSSIEYCTLVLNVYYLLLYIRSYDDGSDPTNEVLALITQINLSGPTFQILLPLPSLQIQIHLHHGTPQGLEASPSVLRAPSRGLSWRAREPLHDQYNHWT